MWHLIRLSLRRWRSQQQSPVKRVPQINGCLNVAAQVCDHDMFVPGSSVRSDVSASGRQREANDAIRVTGHGHRLIKNEWSVRNVINRNYYSNVTGARIGVVCHDGSYRFLEWDSKKSAFVPFVFK
jgi:hypothetical protein